LSESLSIEVDRCADERASERSKMLFSTDILNIRNRYENKRGIRQGATDDGCFKGGSKRVFNRNHRPVDGGLAIQNVFNAEGVCQNDLSGDQTRDIAIYYRLSLLSADRMDKGSI